MVICLATNIVFFSEVRGHFFGGNDPLASAKSAFTELDFSARITEFYPATQSSVEDVTDVTMSR